jgi:hypothetical protein
MTAINFRWKQQRRKILFVKPKAVFTRKLDRIPKKDMLPAQKGQAGKKGRHEPERQARSMDMGIRHA